MNTLKLYYPVKPMAINQGFGANATYYAKFHDNFGNPLQGHDGIDFRAPHGAPVYAAHDGYIHYEKDIHGGEGMVIRTVDEFDYQGAPAYFRTIYWHLIGDTDSNYTSPIPLDGTEKFVNAGDLIGYADNTGAPYESSGDHCHFGLYPSRGAIGATLAEFDANQALCEPRNGFNGRIDAMPYFTGICAADVHELESLYTKLSGLLSMEISAIKAKLHGNAQ